MLLTVTGYKLWAEGGLHFVKAHHSFETALSFAGVAGSLPGVRRD